MSLSQFNSYQQLTSVRVVQASNLAGSYYNGPTNNGVGATLTVTATGQLIIDSVDVNNGDRVLLQAQSSGAQNGIYVVNNNGLGGSNPILQRSADFQNIEQMMIGQYLSVGAGTTHDSEVYVLVEPLPGALGVDAINFDTTAGSVPPGVLLAANNLDDVISVATSRTNLGLGTIATKAASNPADNFAVSSAGATVSGQVAVFADGNGSIAGGGPLAADIQLSTNIKAATSGNIFQAGGPPFVSLPVTVAGLTSSSVVIANIVTMDGASADTAAINRVTPGAGSFTVNTTALPGANLTISYVAFIAAQ